MTTHSPSVSDIDAAIQLNPQLDVEALLLSAMLYSRDNQALTSIATHLSGDHFNNPHYGRLFDAISELVEAGKPHDPASVRGALIKRGGEQQTVLETLVMATTLGANDLEVKHYAAEVSSQAYRRSYHALATSIEHAASAAPEAQLFDILVEHGRSQRALWNQHQSFCADMGAAAGISNSPKESVRDTTTSRTDNAAQRPTPSVSEKVAQGMQLIEAAGVASTPEAIDASASNLTLQDSSSTAADSHLSPMSQSPASSL